MTASESFTSASVTYIRGEITVPGDKSISHRFVMLSSIADGTSRATNLLTGEDCRATITAFSQMGVSIERNGTQCVIAGVGKHGLRKPQDSLYVGNSGTTMRLLAGLLAGQGFDVTITGDASLSRRPMDRVTIPLTTMGARIDGQGPRMVPPLVIRAAQLHGQKHCETIGSAQVKSSLLFAGMYADGETTVVEEKASRDHTERMLAYYQAPFVKEGKRLRISSEGGLSAPRDVFVVPGDISSAAFFIVAALLVPDSELVLRDVCLNPTRTGILTVLKDMGAAISIEEKEGAGEPRGDITVRTSRLRGTVVRRELLPSLIDEVPILLIACALAEGESVIEEASELRVKESDRISVMADGLSAIGASVHVSGDTISITGVDSLAGNATITSQGDHRIAMSFIIAGLVATQAITVEDTACINTSYPSFFEHLQSVVGGRL